MKKQKVILFIIIILLCLVLVNIISNKNIKKETITIREMSETTQVSDLQTQISTLNASHDEYAKNVQAYKTKIAEAITNQGVPTSTDAKTETIVDNIGKILSAKTQATATAAQILKGQTAWVNGSKITGTMVDRGTLNWNPTSSTTKTIAAGYYSGGTLNSSGAYNAGYNAGKSSGNQVISLGTGNTFNVSNYNGYQNFTEDNFYISDITLSCNSYNNYNGLDITSGESSISVSKSYNAATGKLTINNTSTSHSMNNAYGWAGGSASISCSVVLIIK